MSALRSLVLAATMALGAALLTPVHADAAPRTFRHATARVTYVADPELLKYPEAAICMGYNNSYGPNSGCAGWMYGLDGFVPTAQGFTAVVQWLAGRKPYATQRFNVRRNTGPFFAYSPHKGLTYDASKPGGGWRWKGKSVSFRVTFTKKGYRTKVITIAGRSFEEDDE